MINTMKIQGHTAVISFDPELGRFRGEFVGLNGGADFFAESVDALRTEGKRSLETFSRSAGSAASSRTGSSRASSSSACRRRSTSAS